MEKTGSFDQLREILERTTLLPAYYFLLGAAGNTDQLYRWHDNLPDDGGLLQPSHRLLRQHRHLLKAAWMNLRQSGTVWSASGTATQPYADDRLRAVMADLLQPRDSWRRPRDDRPMFDYYRHVLLHARRADLVGRAETWVVQPPLDQSRQSSYVVALHANQTVTGTLRCLLHRDTHAVRAQIVFSEDQLDADLTDALLQIPALMRAPYQRNWLPNAEDIRRQQARDEVHFDFLLEPASSDLLKPPVEEIAWQVRAQAGLEHWLAYQLNMREVPVTWVDQPPALPARPAHAALPP